MVFQIVYSMFSGMFVILLVPWTTVRLTSIDHPQIGGKFTATSGGLTRVFYGCKD